MTLGMDARGAGFLLDRGPNVLGHVRSAARGAYLRVAGPTLPDAHRIGGSRVVLDQEYANACLGFGSIGAVHRFTGARGKPTLLSPWYTYWHANLIGMGSESSMADIGARPKDLLASYAKFGAVPFDDWNPGPHGAMLRPKPVIRMNALKTRVTFAPIYDSGSTLVERICDSIAIDQPPVLALPVYPSFRKTNGIDPVSPGGSSEGILHLVVADEYVTDGKRRLITILNSWGRFFGNNGTAVLTPEYVQRAVWVAYLKDVRFG